MSTVEQPRIGFVGAGRHSSLNLYPAFAATGVPLAGIAERNPARVAEAEARGIRPIFPNHLALIEATDLDGIIVSLAPHLQAEVVADCVRAGVAVFVEKPLGSTGSRGPADCVDRRGCRCARDARLHEAFRPGLHPAQGPHW
ncbi:Gfo/Idh/MocA family oxidoreductase [Salinibacterium sp. M195]|uniref:Gfo/Idh/MocA family oxidoreductase n=1 Tax=Salinibacterium sp. M195 TaxID=2583374 RepID=UPI001C62B442|nr:Gfo/Idh/MocA family oxidoreductase [Salinibacterium sp. M195]QYH34546.1 Gfo/Idh/MocA family oxidoreductase [Salinibacterium sp. M195]